jgi:hypothetical protein
VFVSDDSRLTKQALVAGARDCGLPVTVRLASDWQSLGLIVEPRKRGRGRGRGVEATWSHAQAAWFYRMLEKRQSGATIASLTNLVATAWLGRFDDVVSPAQVIRALTTWTRTARRASRRASHATAKALVTSLETQGVRPRDRAALVQTLTDLTYRAVADPIPLDPTNLKGQLESPLADRASQSSSSDEGFIHILEARVLAVDSLASGTLDEPTLNLARLHYDVTRAAFAAQRGPSAPLEELTEIVNNACLDLLTVVGLIELDRRAHADG